MIDPLREGSHRENTRGNLEYDGGGAPDPGAQVSADALVDPSAHQFAVVKSWIERVGYALPHLIALGALLGYSLLFYRSIAPYWFSPEWTTDDALQQLFPFHKILDPELFRGDFITQAMEGYLTPLHWTVTAGATLLTGDPLMAAHWVFLLQLVLTAGFLGGAVYVWAGGIPAMLSVVWLLHSRNVVQRLTCGLVRGWAAPVFAAFFFFAARKSHWGMIATLVVGCLLHPPATFLIATAYGLLLILDLIDTNTRAATIQPLLRLVCVAPGIAALAWMVVQMPPEIGSMTTYDEALAMPEFESPGGRFPFTPLVPIGEELRTYGFQAFLSKWFRLGRIGGDRTGLPIDCLFMGGAVLSYAALLWLGYRRKSSVVPRATLAFLIATVSVYILSRIFAFRLYVPNRHLQLPLLFFFVVAFSVGFYRFGSMAARWVRLRVRGTSANRPAGRPCAPECRASEQWGGLIALTAVALVVWMGSGDGLFSTLNFNWHLNQRGGAWRWLEAHTDKAALIGGHPTFIDPVQLLGKRVGYVTTETAHPFYKEYYHRLVPRVETSLRAHYAASLQEVYELTSLAGIDYFVFERKRFYPEELQTASYFKPYNVLVQELASRPWQEYAYRQIPTEITDRNAPYVVFRDAYSVIIDVRTLGAFLAQPRAVQSEVLR